MPGPVREKPGQNGHADTSWQMHQHPGVQGSYSPHMFSQLTAQPHPDNLHTVSTAGEWVATKGSLQARRDGFIHIPPCASQESTGSIKGATPYTCLPLVPLDLGVQ